MSWARPHAVAVRRRPAAHVVAIGHRGPRRFPPGGFVLARPSDREGPAFHTPRPTGPRQCRSAWLMAPQRATAALRHGRASERGAEDWTWRTASGRWWW